MARIIRPTAIVVAGALALCGCRSEDDSNQAPADQFLITGAAMSGYGENVLVSLNGVAATGLTVTVNSTALAEQSPGTYYGVLAPTVSPGGTVQLTVTNGTSTASATGVVPAEPVISSADHSTMGQPVTVTWTTTASPDSFVVSVNYHLSDGVTAAAVVDRVAGTARQAVLPTTSIPTGSTVFSVGLDARVRGSFSGAADPKSNMNLRTSAASFDLTIP